MMRMYPLLNVKYNEGFDDAYLGEERKNDFGVHEQQFGEQLAYDKGYDDAVKYAIPGKVAVRGRRRSAK